VVDVRDTDALRGISRQASRAFVLNPPVDPSRDSNAAELETMRGILAALQDSGLQAVVAESTLRARVGETLGDLSVLHASEQGLKSQSIPCGIVRAAYYLTNWEGQLATVRARGVLMSFLQVFAHLFGGVAHGADDLPETIDRDTQRLGPIAHLVRLVQRNELLINGGCRCVVCRVDLTNGEGVDARMRRSLALSKCL
jgi:hypothetical protein